MVTREDMLKIILGPVAKKNSEEVLYVAFQADDPRYQCLLDDGSTEPDGFQLGHLRKLLHGDEGNIPGPLNTLYPVSLKPWVNADPETLYLHIEVPVVSPQSLFQHPPITAEEEKTFEFRLVVRQAASSDCLFFLASGRLITQGSSLASLRKRFGGDEGEIEGPGGKMQHVSLAPWADADPMLTFVQFNWAQKLPEEC